MESTEILTYAAFDGHELLIQGALEEVVLKIKRRVSKIKNASILVFNESNGQTLDFDLRGSEKDVLERLHIYVSDKKGETLKTSGPGRPRLGVISREISLLPRHWEWLATQSGGASATLRRLVEESKKKDKSKDQIKAAQERTYKFLSALAGDLPHYEEALRVLYKRNRESFKDQIKDWPRDIRHYALHLALPVFEGEK